MDGKVKINIAVIGIGNRLPQRHFGDDQHNFTLAMLLVALVWGVSMLQEKFNKDGMTIRDVIAKQNILFRWLLYLALIAGILVFGMYGSGYNAGAFFYGKF